MQVIDMETKDLLGVVENLSYGRVDGRCPAPKIGAHVETYGIGMGTDLRAVMQTKKRNPIRKHLQNKKCTEFV